MSAKRGCIVYITIFKKTLILICKYYLLHAAIKYWDVASNYYKFVGHKEAKNKHFSSKRNKQNGWKLQS